MSQRDGDLFLDAGHLCFPSNWSLSFKLGMKFKEIHQPIPMFSEKSLDDRILRFSKNIEQGAPWTRKNWSLMAGKRLDTSLETFDQWGKDRKKVTADNVGEFVHLRVEVQKLFRLAASNGLLFTIHTHLLPLEQFTLNKEWLEQFYKILCELPDFILDYKGISSYKNEVITYLKNKLDEVG
ncbi:heme-dependent oxidative N-demethylase subunit alpha family protein [Gottfriedia acidiceleris]|uniref:heme-dependent oxidative N-demethylase subunit alpha family protein n=1 Tax=Gottfriedia acidiceleris TaxID=371036 RepID=UPI002FFF939C